MLTRILILTLLLMILLLKSQALNYKLNASRVYRFTGILEEIHHQDARPQPICYSSTAFNNITKIENAPSKTNFTSSTRRKKTSFQETQEDSLITKEAFNTELNNFIHIGTKMDKKNGISFDFRKREDAYKITDPREYPYSVIVLLFGHNLFIFGFCTGSLITEEWVLTAAHCIDSLKIKSVWVYAGGNSIDEVKDYFRYKAELLHTAQLIVAEKIIPHPLFTTDSSNSNVGLVRMSKKFNMTNTVNIVGLSNKPWEHHGYTSCVTTGFGLVFYSKKTKYDGHRKTHTLEAKKPCICNFMLRSKINSKFSTTSICSKPRQDYGICFGDSGGGLVCQDDGAMKIRGIAAYIVPFVNVEYCETHHLLLFEVGGIDIECAEATAVSVFQDTCPYLPWINQYVKLFSEDELEECKESAATSATMYTSLRDLTGAEYLVIIFAVTYVYSYIIIILK